MNECRSQTKNWERERRGKERISMALNIGRGGGIVTYLSLQYNKVLLGTVIWFSHMALELGQLYVHWRKDRCMEHK